MNWNELKSKSLDEILAWAETQAWQTPMVECVQDAQWHAEGDVWTHTKLVCEQLLSLEQWPELTKHQQVVLIFTALFHDSAKPLTSQIDPDTGRVTSPKHAVKGEHVARRVLRELDCDLETREEIARLVRFHGRPAFLTEKDDPAREVVTLSWLVENQLLYLFAIADTLGRKTDSMSRPKENLEYWKLLAKEYDCFHQPYAFGNDHARFLYFRERKHRLSYTPHEEYSCVVTMMSGLPGAGKDTWLAKHRDQDTPVVSLDAIRKELGVGPTEDQGRVVQQAQEQCRELLRKKTSFAFNATNILRQTRQRWINLFHDYRARIELIYVEPKIENVLMQNKLRNSVVPEHVIWKLALKTEPPTWTEGHQVTLTTGAEQP